MRASSGNRSSTSGIVPSMLNRLADALHARPRLVVAAAVATTVVAGVFGASTARQLSSSDNDFQDPASQSFRTQELLAHAAGAVPGPSILVVATPAQATVAAAMLRREPTLTAVRPR